MRLGSSRGSDSGSGGGGDRLLLVVHHLGVDGVSWRILLEDLERGYAGEGLGAKTVSFQRWAAGMKEYAESEEMEEEAGYWEQMLGEGRETAWAVPLDGEDGSEERPEPARRNVYGDAGVVQVELGEEETRALLQEAGVRLKAQAEEVLVAALVQVLGEWTGQEEVVLELEGHGRESVGEEDLDVTRTVGWFTSLYPVRVDVGKGRSGGEVLAAVKERLRGVPHRGLGYGLLRYVRRTDEARQRMRRLAGSQVVFNYSSRAVASIDDHSPWIAAGESAGLHQAPQNVRSHVLDVSAMIIGSRLNARWGYNTLLHGHETIATLAHSWISGLQQLIRGASTEESCIPSDFPLAKIDSASLLKLLRQTRDVHEIYSPSPMQQGMLFHTLYAPSSGVYVNQIAARQRGALDVDVLCEAWRQVIARHDVLRTSFHWTGLDQPQAVVHKDVTLPWSEVDLQGMNPRLQESMIKDSLRKERSRGFTLTQAPLVRLTVFRLSDNQWELVWSNHHLILDGWSLPILLKEVFLFYAALHMRKSSRLAPVRSFTSYIAWLQQQDAEEAKCFWKAQMAGFVSRTPLPMEGERSWHKNAEGRYSTLECRLSEDETAALLRTSRQHGVTLSTLVWAAWALLLSRYSAQNDVVFGATVAGRPPTLPDVENMVGLFINTLPVRTSIDDSVNVETWLRELQTQSADMQQYQHASLSDIHRWSNVPRGMPLFESIVVFENYPVDRSIAAGFMDIDIQRVEATEQTNYPLTLGAAAGSRFLLSLSYDCDRYAGEGIRRMLRQLQTLLLGLISDIRQPIVDVPMITAVEREALLAECAANSTHYKIDSTAHRLFEQLVISAPDAIALVCQEQHFTYTELNARANQLARYLIRMGVGPEVRVGILLGRTPDLLVAILGIWKAGGAYVPIDPCYPAERVSYLLSDAGVTVVLTDSTICATSERFEPASCSVLCLDSEWPRIANESTGNPDRAIASDTLAYVIYTSGSTGKPKGVMIGHRGLANLAFSVREAYSLQSTDRHLQMANVTFDVFVGDILRSLCTGAAIVLCPRELMLDAPRLYQFMETHNINCAELVPVVMRYLLLHLKQTGKRLDFLRVVVCGADVWPMHEYQQTRQLCAPQTKVINSYGVTEATIDSSFFESTGSLQETDGNAPIGRPLANVAMYVLDHNMEPVPVGVPGELYIGGAGIGRGYLNNPERTAHVFVPDPFNKKGFGSRGHGGRLYKTGDLVRRVQDGSIQFLDRIDTQFKLRGFRIEPAEIEATLTQHPAVLEAAVALRDGGSGEIGESGEKRLAAYFVPRPEHPVPDPEALRSFLKNRLPDYMVPSVFVVLAEWPLNANGKLDRRALPAPNWGAIIQETNYVPPETSAERALVEIWQKVLGVERISLQDNFFALGGDSIAIIQVIARAANAGLNLSPRQMFEHPSIAELAADLEVGPGSVLAAEQGPVQGHVPFTPIQQDFLAQDSPDPGHYNHALLMRIPAHADVRSLDEAIYQVIVHHDALRLRLLHTDRGWQQEIAGLQALQRPSMMMIDLSEAAECDRKQLLEGAAAHAQKTLVLAEGCLLRAVYFDLGAREDGRLLLIVHHLAVDGVSWRILLEDLQTCYGQLSQAQAVKLPAKTTSFQEWATWLEGYAQSGEIAEEASVWLHTMEAGADTTIPVDFPENANEEGNTQASSHTVWIELDARNTQELVGRVTACYQSNVQEILLAAFVLAFVEWAGQRQVLIDIESHGREQIVDSMDVSRTVGWFTAVYPVLLRVSDRRDPLRVLRDVRDQMRRVKHGGIGYGLLRHLRENDEMSARLQVLPSPVVSFNYLGQFRPSTDGSSWQMASESFGTLQSPNAARSYLLDINALVTEKTLRISYSYSVSLYDVGTIDALGSATLHHLHELIRTASSREDVEVINSSNLEIYVGRKNLEDLYAQLEKR